MYRYAICLFVAALFAHSAPCAVTVYYNSLNHPAARLAWMTDAGNFATNNFTGFADNTIITTQYQSEGLVFSDGTDRITHNPNAFPNDGQGLRGVLDEISIDFASPTYAIAADYPGALKFRLYWQGALTYTSPDFVNGGNDFFAGLISTTPFDAAIISDPTGNVNIDDLFFGPPIPAPPAFALLALAAFGPRRRRPMAGARTTRT